jgi:hypothetical protein
MGTFVGLLSLMFLLYLFKNIAAKMSEDTTGEGSNRSRFDPMQYIRSIPPPSHSELAEKKKAEMPPWVPGM